MTRKIACTLAVLGTLTASTQAQESKPNQESRPNQESVPKPTKADAANVVKIISTDKTKIKNYCRLADIGDEINKASGAGDKHKIELLGKQADDLGKTLGPEFIRLNAGLEDLDLQSPEGQELSAELDKLDKLCPPK